LPGAPPGRPLGAAFLFLRLAWDTRNLRRRPSPHPLWYSLPNPVATDKNKLYYGDNLEVLTRNVKDE